MGASPKSCTFKNHRADLEEDNGFATIGDRLDHESKKKPCTAFVLTSTTELIKAVAKNMWHLECPFHQCKVWIQSECFLNHSTP